MYIAIGKILRPHGVKGFVKAVAYSGLPDRFSCLKSVYVQGREGLIGYRIERWQLLNELTLLKLQGVENREEAQKLTNVEMLVPEEQKVPLPQNSYFVHDLIGIEVFDTTGRKLGILQEVLSNGGGDLYQVQTTRGELLIPAVSEFVKQVDVSQKRMIVKLIEGMMD